VPGQFHLETVSRIPGIYLTILLVATGGATGIVLGISVSENAGGLHAAAPMCPGNATIEINATTYWDCDVFLDWSIASGFGSTSHVYQTFHGVTFDVYGYSTMNGSVVNVTGHEGAISFSFLVHPAPYDCRFYQSTVWSPDLAFGATWAGGSWVALLVRFPPM
jgi:hypothetical protein